MTGTDAELAILFLDCSRKKLLEESWPRLKNCVAALSEAQLWWRPNDASNSIGNLLLHLNGNVTQWLLVSFNKNEDRRNRPAEFAARQGTTPAELLAMLGATLNEVAVVLRRLTVEELLAQYQIQGYHVRGLEAVYHVVEHFGQHYGQIAYIAKTLGGRDLGFFKELDMTGRAE